MKLIYDNLEKLIALCRKYKVKNMYVFGSILTQRFNDESDVDLSVDMLPDSDPLVSGRNFLNLYLDLQDLFARKVDLVDEASIRNPYFKEELNETKQLIYG
ncbi:MAG: nucleotidyltransferase [Bacteroidales bacterium]|nr:nucleotidyltransferase [Bacteroidales bacterium]